MPSNASTSAELILPLDIGEAPLDRVGGKARGLMRLTAAGLPVPEGFCLTTKAYRTVTAGAIGDRLAVAGTDPARAAELQALLLRAPIPAEIEAAITAAYDALCKRDGEERLPVAVRSSATAEDLPDLSFAGQQASFLNVVGPASLIDAVRHCWASLYAESAIAYRSRMGVSEQTVAMAVVVQRLVEAEVSGVLFTANPTTGDRSEIVINASYGLGEAVVGGHVSADTWLMDRGSGRIRETIPGSKTDRVVTVTGGGTRTEPVPESMQRRAALDDPALRRLADLAMATEAVFGTPQDMEWALAGGDLHLLQSRPMTSLPTPPLKDVRWEPPGGAKMLVRRQVVENMPEPLSPLFEEVYLEDGLDRGMDALIDELGLPMSIDDFVHRPMFVTVNGYGYSRYDLKPGWHWLTMIPKIFYFYFTGLPRVIRNLEDMWSKKGLPDYLAVIGQWEAVDASRASDTRLLEGITTLARADAAYWGYITMMVGAAKVSEAMLAWFLGSRFVRAETGSGAYLRGFPSRIRAAQEALEALAREVAVRDPIRSVVAGKPPDALLEALHRTPGGERLAARLADHLAAHGHQVFNLDFAEPTLGERPEFLLGSFKSLVASPPEQGPSAGIVAEREALVERTATTLGPVRRWLFRVLLRWAQRFAPGREDALYYMGAAWPVVRRLALALDERLVSSGSLEHPEDVFYLRRGEIAAALRPAAVHGKTDAQADTTALARERRTLREARMRLHPPGRVPADLRIKIGPFDVTRFFETWETQKRNPVDADMLTGFAVSPGRVTAPACLILRRDDFGRMRPGSILVCPTTTPAWTPLFNQAVGLVTDIGSVLAHGSIVAREYGIPAVLGTGNATERIRDGEVITVDGDAGEVRMDGRITKPTR